VLSSRAEAVDSVPAPPLRLGGVTVMERACAASSEG